ncbi:hypothetical protein GCM10010199_74240 [Dactylosporangium roseum]
MDFPSYLATMPMHAITEIYGEAGLRERFRLEIERFDEASRQRLGDALTLAADLHRDDRRVREPYLNHLLRVAIRITHHYEVDDVDVPPGEAAHLPPARPGRGAVRGDPRPGPGRSRLITRAGVGVRGRPGRSRLT